MRILKPGLRRGAWDQVPTVDLLADACDGLPHTRRAMFGGHGFFAPHRGMFAALVDDDRIALKFVEEADADDFLAIGARPWVHEGRTRMSHWYVVPDDLLDQPHALAEWARRAHAKSVPPKPRRRTKRSGKGAS